MADLDRETNNVFEDSTPASNNTVAGWDAQFWDQTSHLASLARKDFMPGIDDKTTIVLPNGLTIHKPSEDHQEVFCNAVLFLYAFTHCKCTISYKTIEQSKSVIQHAEKKPRATEYPDADSYRAATLQWSWTMFILIMDLQEVIGFGGVKRASARWK